MLPAFYIEQVSMEKFWANSQKWIQGEIAKHKQSGVVPERAEDAQYQKYDPQKKYGTFSPVGDSRNKIESDGDEDVPLLPNPLFIFRRVKGKRGKYGRPKTGRGKEAKKRVNNVLTEQQMVLGNLGGTMKGNHVY